MIEFDGIENYTFEILKEVSRPELCYWEDYFILKFNTFYPNGYNKKWNCNEDIRKEIQSEIEKEKIREKAKEDFLKKQEEELLTFCDNEVWIEKYFDYRLFSLYCFLLKNTVQMGEDKLIVCKPYFTNRFVSNAIRKKINLSDKTITKYLDFFQKVGIIKNNQLIEIKTISNYFDLELFDNQNLLYNILLWNIRKENQLKNNFFFYKKDFAFAMTKLYDGQKLQTKKGDRIEIALLQMEKKGLISMKPITSQYGLEIIAL